MSLLNAWHRLHHTPRYLRWPAKLLFLILITGLVLYPRFWLIPRWLHRLADLDSVITPTDSALAPLEQRCRQDLPSGNLTIDELAARVEQLVYAALPYAHDWDTWGVMDYLPTPAEALARGQEDCDGRAAVAAALLRRLGYNAHLVSDLKHTWVEISTSDDDSRVIAALMAPGTGARSLAGTTAGTRTTLNVGMVANVGRALAYGIAVFPLNRELIILAALLLVTLHPRTGRHRAVAAAILFVIALTLLRCAGISPDALAQRPALPWLALIIAVGGWTLLAYKPPRRRQPAL